MLPGLHNTFAMVLMGSGVPAHHRIYLDFRPHCLNARRDSGGGPLTAETQGLLVAVAVVTVGFATRNLFDYMFAGSLAHLFWILVAAGLCSVRPQISTEAGPAISL